MSGRGAELQRRFSLLPDEATRLQDGIGELQALLRDLVRAFAPPNAQYERERIIAQTPNPREIAFVLGLLSEGENEAALLLELIAPLLAATPQADVSHVVDEAWYYLRTSIDATWQLDDGNPCASAALAYLVAVLEERLAHLNARPRTAPLADEIVPEHRPMLRALRAQLCS